MKISEIFIPSRDTHTYDNQPSVAEKRVFLVFLNCYAERKSCVKAHTEAPIASLLLLLVSRSKCVCTPGTRRYEDEREGSAGIACMEHNLGHYSPQIPTHKLGNLVRAGRTGFISHVWWNYPSPPRMKVKLKRPKAFVFSNASVNFTTCCQMHLSLLFHTTKNLFSPIWTPAWSSNLVRHL